MKFIRSTLLLLAATFILPSTSFAFDTPTETTRLAVKAVKSEGPKGMMNYIHWQSVYDSFPPQQRRLLNINSVSDLRSYYKSIFTNPIEATYSRMSSQFANLPPEARAMMKAQMAKMSASINSEVQKEFDKVKRTTFKIGQESVSGKKATVKLTTYVDGKTELHTVNLVNVGSRWLLSAVPEMGKATQPKTY